jgi:hypothetical protein
MSSTSIPTRPSSPTSSPPVVASSIEEYDHLAINDWAAAGAAPVFDIEDPPPDDVQTDHWALAKIIAIQSHSVTLVESGSGNLIKARPQSFAETRHDGSLSFINIKDLGLLKGDIVECCIADSPWDNWDSNKGGKDIKGWVLECLPQCDRIFSNGALTDTPRAAELSFQFNATVKSSGPKFSILSNISRDGALIDGFAFCPDFNELRGSIVSGSAFPFVSTNNKGLSTHFVVSHISMCEPPKKSAITPSNRRSNRPSALSYAAALRL